MARSRDNRAGYSPKQLAAKNDSKDDDGAILGEVVNPNLVSAETVDKFAEPGRELAEFKDFLAAVNDFTREQALIVREHARDHPDAIDHRKTRRFRRGSYYGLLAISATLLGSMPFVNLVVAGTFGIMAMLIICAVILNARDREMDFGGLLKMIQTVLKKGQQQGQQR